MPLSRDRKLAIYEALVSALPDVDRKGQAMPYTALNGNMFSFLAPDGALAFRLPSAARTAFLERHPDAIVEQYGRVMKDYVAVPDPILEAAEECELLFAQSVAHARTLRPKATTRAKPKPKPQ